MEDVRIFRSDEIQEDPLVGGEGDKAGWRKKIIYPQNVTTKGAFFGIAEVNPGFSPHRWHHHMGDTSEGFEIVYPEDFEEINYIMSGSGVVQWETEDGKIVEEKVNAGDTVFFPVGVAKHQILNNGTEKMVVIYCGSPTVEYVPIK
jgi:oxalate decarboxylase/phosphoglucose isomerase-like protein (cupin superfamily)